MLWRQKVEKGKPQKNREPTFIHPLPENKTSNDVIEAIFFLLFQNKSTLFTPPLVLSRSMTGIRKVSFLIKRTSWIRVFSLERVKKVENEDPHERVRGNKPFVSSFFFFSCSGSVLEFSKLNWQKKVVW